MSIDAILSFLSRHKSGPIALVGHQRPDGDAIGACLGLASVLQSIGRETHVVNLLPVPERLHFLDLAPTRNDDSPDWHKKYACLGVLDCGDINRLDEINRPAATALPVFNIDHHISSSGVGEAVWIDPVAGSVGEMVVRLCQAAGWPLTAPAANALWTAIVTDTGRFSFENTTIAGMEAAVACLAAGAKPAEVANHVYQSIGVGERYLQAKVLTRMELFENGRMAMAWMRQDDFAAASIGPEGAQDLINLLRDTNCVEVAVFLYETPGPDAGVKVSLRTQSPHNAVTLAAKYGGGGHTRAAGGYFSGTVEEARQVILEEARKIFFP